MMDISWNTRKRSVGSIRFMELNDYPYIIQRETYLRKVLELRSEGTGYSRISKIVPVPEATIRRWCVKFVPTTQQVHSTMKKSAQTKVCQTSSQPSLPDDVLSLQAELERLRSQLIDAEIKAEAYDELINVAEAKFGICIRKKLAPSSE